MYTMVHFIPGDSQWLPDEGSLRDLLGYFGAETVSVSAYDEPARWDAEDPMNLTWRHERISREEALEFLRDDPPMTAMLVLKDLKWNDPLIAWLDANIPADIADGYLAWDVGLWIGPMTISDPLGEKFAAEAQFAITISGDGMPSDLGEYLELMTKAPEIIQLNQKLAKLTGSPWRNLIVASY